MIKITVKPVAGVSPEYWSSFINGFIKIWQTYIFNRLDLFFRSLVIKHTLLDYDTVIVEGWLRTLAFDKPTNVYVQVILQPKRDCISLQKLIFDRELPIRNMYLDTLSIHRWL